MSFQFRGLAPQSFEPLFLLDDVALAARRVQRVFADDSSSFPCRVSLAHAVPGEELLLLSHEHQPAASPYRSTGPIFVRRGAAQAAPATGEVPLPVQTRLVSVRAYDAQDCIVEAEVVDGAAIAPLIGQFFDNPVVDYLHVHYARRGCFAARVDRA